MMMGSGIQMRTSARTGDESVRTFFGQEGDNFSVTLSLCYDISMTSPIVT